MYVNLSRAWVLFKCLSAAMFCAEAYLRWIFPVTLLFPYRFTQHPGTISRALTKYRTLDVQFGKTTAACTGSIICPWFSSGRKVVMNRHQFDERREVSWQDFPAALRGVLLVSPRPCAQREPRALGGGAGNPTAAGLQGLNPGVGGPCEFCCTTSKLSRLTIAVSLPDHP